METSDKYIELLRQDIEDKFNRSFRSATDFDALEMLVKQNSPGTLNASTLKRIWGYSKTTSKPLRSTLTILANMLGFRDWESYVEKIRSDSRVESGFTSRSEVSISTLKPGDVISFQWRPDRETAVRCLDREYFEVMEQKNSSLRPGDRFRVRFLREGYPLYCEDVIRDGENLGDYVAGEETGIRQLRYLPAE